MRYDSCLAMPFRTGIARAFDYAEIYHQGPFLDARFWHE
jgi:hypothetical protein